MMYTPTPDFYNDYIQHFNPFHDPRNGQFTTGRGGGSITRLQKKAAKANKKAAQAGNDFLHPFKAKKKDKLQTKAFKAQYKADKLNAQLEKEKYKQEIEDIRNTAKTDEEKDIRLAEADKNIILKKAEDDLNRRWGDNESYDDYVKRQISAYDGYSKSFSKETKKAEAEFNSALNGITPKENDKDDARRKYASVSALLSPYYDRNSFEDTMNHIWFYKYEDGDQGSNNSAMAQLVSNYGYDNAKKRIDNYFNSERKLEEAMSNDFGKDTAHKLISARSDKDDKTTNMFSYRVRDSEISESKEAYEKAIKKSELLNDAADFALDTKRAAEQVANKIRTARKSGLTYEEIADKYDVSTSFISDVLELAK